VNAVASGDAALFVNSASWAAWLATYALHSTVALAAAWLMSAVARRRAVVLQELVLWLAMVVPLASATVQFFVFGPIWGFGGLGAAPQPVVLDDVPFVLDDLGPAVFEAVAPAPAAAAASLPPLREWMLLLAALSALGGLTLLLVRWVRLGRLLAQRRPETDGRVLAAAARVAHEMGCRQTPRISRSPVLATPVAFGWLRPEVCLPARAPTLADPLLDAMLGHEVAHLRRGDPGRLWFAAVLAAVFPWQLLLLPVRRRWLRAMELRCDAIAAERSSASAVAHCLVEVAQWLAVGSRQSALAAGMAARPSALRERVEVALAGGAVPVPRDAVRVGLAALIIVAMTVAAPGVPFHALRSEPAANEATPSDRTTALLDDVSDGFDGEHFDPAAATALLALLDAETEEVAAEARELGAKLRQRRGAQGAALADALEARLQHLVRLRARLAARLGPFPSRNR
jgi:beta-lactamase regulating signal transducer with metallopeptidase domain